MAVYSPSAGVGYPSLFRSEAEIPKFFPGWRWWEDESQTIFWAFDSQELKRAIQFGLYQDENLPRRILQGRHENTIDAFLVSLLEPNETVSVANMGPLQKVEEIMRRCRLTRPLESWSWVPVQRDRDATARTIADAIDAESHLHFTRLSFEELVRYSLGNKTPSVEWFLQQHTALYMHLLGYLRAFPEEMSRYREVEQHLRSRSPFAHRALATCLRALGCGSVPVSASPGFAFIAGPIQSMFKVQSRSLADTLKVLSVLGVRFKRTYVHAREISWTQPFDVEHAFLEELLMSTSGADLARTLDADDKNSFTGLTQKSFIEPDALLKGLLAQWEILGTTVWECCTGLPDHIAKLQDCLHSLLPLKNYHSFTALLTGFQKHSVTHPTFIRVDSATNTMTLHPVLAPEAAYVIDPLENFVAYRQDFQTTPGIPFLVPHIREYQQHGPPALQQLFQSLGGVEPFCR
ncbi:hypothetical protein BO70DRAFT_291758 [Aspergillus heteromorphus CBS 117.55]|uniref:Ras-GEF domain-containing protein n=1 Tax=Aspergillus heteromorphus CBS 117.55 TaxID=1448321 RepID=A0A317WA45_9EURO|nr:uncharacterized protein BO70DRAFT_291758 [Aspergillus heteromorphus CBS 117.55]PWY82197.1 hypothetical protein BO70DRAFT_291758 [Aspergillus heteromorphus CBS 117.55]